MKIRNGFVSNSSSSSYIIAMNKNSLTKPIQCEHCGHIDTDFINVVERLSIINGENDVKAEGFQEIIKYLLDGYDLPRHEIDEIKKKMEFYPDKKLALVSISYHEDILNDLIHSKNIVIIHKLFD